MVEAPPRDEHALVVVKPGPRAAEVASEVARRAAAEGLEVVARRRRVLEAAEVRDAFKYWGPPFSAMWCGGESEAWLLRGPGAPERALALKQALRADLAADEHAVYNLVHVADSGWEVARQLALYFPELPLRRYAGYADLLLREPDAAAITDSSAGVVALLADPFDLAPVRLADALLDRLVLRAVERDGLVALFPSAAPLPDGPPPGAFVEWARAHGGVVAFGACDYDFGPPPNHPGEQEAATRRVVADWCDILPQGLDALVVVEPRRTAWQLEILWDVAEHAGIANLGGTNGRAPACTWAIDRADFLRLWP